MRLQESLAVVANRRGMAGVRLPLTVRSLVIGAIGAAAVCFIIGWGEMTVGAIQIAICQFNPAAIGLLLPVVLANLLIGALRPRLALRPHEVIVIYVMILSSALTMSRGLLERWVPALVAVNYYDNPSNKWGELFYEHIPQWAVPFDVAGPANQRIAREFYEGIKPGTPLPWRQWLPALAAWLPAVLAMFVAYFCLASILRRQWVDNEKLAFPLTILPVEMAAHSQWSGSLFGNRLAWIGFGIPFVVFTINGLHTIWPTVPEIPVQYRLNELVFQHMGRPWRDLGFTTAYCSMAAVGFAYFLPAQVLLSLWAFFVIIRLQNIVFSAFGAPPEAMPLYPTTLWNGYQVMGAYLVLTGYLIKSAWPHLRQIWAAAVAGSEFAPTGAVTSRYGVAAEQARPALPPRVACISLAAAATVAAWWFTVLGMSTWMAVVEVVVFLGVVCVVMARSVGEAGLLMTETSFRPVDMVRLVTPMKALGAPTLTALSLADAVFTRDLRGNLLSTLLDGLKMSDLTSLDRRHLFAAVALALAVCLTVGGWLHLALPYANGAVSMYSYVYRGNPLLGFRYFAPILQSGDEYDARLPVFFGSGVLVALGLSWLRTHYVWWPLSPLGLALSGSWSMIVFWFPMLVAWLIKSAVVRYGGMHLYSRLRPLFLGLILGEFSQAVIWSTICGIYRTPAPFFPWP